jgi:hypothetical protein
VQKYLDASEDRKLWNENLSKEDLAAAVLDIKNLDDFPIDNAKSAAIVQAVVKEVRNTKHRNDQRSQSRSASRGSSVSRASTTRHSTSRSASPVKGLQKRSRDDETDDDENEGPVNRGKRQRHATRGRPRKRSSAGRKSLEVMETIETDDSQH